MVRIKLNKSFFYLFLVWNIFLAIIPYAITMYLETIKLNRLKLGFWFCIWLLFLPNAPYIITDLLHIKVSHSNMLWLDILVILSFASTGLLLFYLTLEDMKTIIRKQLTKILVNNLMTIIIFLSAFGIYLGRYLRYNSWEIISHPQILIGDIINIIISPLQNSEAWLFTFGFGSFLAVGYWIFSILMNLKSRN